MIRLSKNALIYESAHQNFSCKVVYPSSTKSYLRKSLKSPSTRLYFTPITNGLPSTTGKYEEKLDAWSIFLEELKILSFTVL